MCSSRFVIRQNGYSTIKSQRFLKARKRVDNLWHRFGAMNLCQAATHLFHRRHHGDGNHLWAQGGKTGDNLRMFALQERNMIDIKDVKHCHASVSASSTSRR